MKKDSVEIWIKETSPKAWSRQQFEVVRGHDDLVRTRLDWYVGEDPRQGDMTLDNWITSEPDPHARRLMIDTHTFAGGVHSSESEEGQEPVYLADQLVGQARQAGTLYIDPA